MSESETGQFECVGCHAMNPVGAEVCAGCGHRFVGPGGGVQPESITAMANRLASPVPDDRIKSGKVRVSAPLGCLYRLVTLIFVSLAVILSFVTGIYVTCSALPESPSAIALGLLAGIVSAAVLIVIVLKVGNYVRTRQ